MTIPEIPAGVTQEELDAAITILKEDLSGSDLRKLRQRLDEIETKRSEKDARDDERWAKWEAQNAGQAPSTEPTGGPNNPPSGPPADPPNPGPTPPPVKSSEPPETDEKPRRKRWYETDHYGK